jgi:hypothetical protein
MHNCFRFRFADVRCAGASGGRAAVDAVHMQRVIEARAEGGGRQGVADGARRDDLSRPQRVRGGQRQFLQVVGDQNGAQRRLFARDGGEGVP